MIPFKQFIHEARRNPELNPKVSVNEVIIKHFNKAKTIPGSRIKNSFTSFTKLDKLGVNPMSEYYTPLGIYSYPNEHIVKKIGERGEMRRLPFAGDSPYANVFSVKGSIVDLNNMSKSDLSRYHNRAIDVYTKAISARKGTQEYEDAAKKIDEYMDIAKTYSPSSNSIGGVFWYFTQSVASLMMGPWNISRHEVSWNKLFRELGVDGCVDMGKGIIHPSEPIQGVFFSKKAIAQNTRVYNKYSPELISRQKEMGQRRAYNATVGMQDMQRMVDENDTEAIIGYLYNADSQIYTMFIKKFALKDEEMLKLAVRVNPGRFIQTIPTILKKPMRKAMELALQVDSTVLKDIIKYNPPIDLIVKALLDNPINAWFLGKDEDLQIRVLREIGPHPDLFDIYANFNKPSERVKDTVQRVMDMGDD